MMSEDTLILKVVTIALALYGALLSTLVAAWNIYWAITDRGRLQVTVTLADMVQPGVGTIASNKLWYKIVNIGRKPIWLSQIGGGYRNGKYFLIVLDKPVPIKLEPGETFDDASSDATNLQQRLDGPDGIKFLGAWDTIGKVHQLSWRGFRRLVREVRAVKKH